MENKREYLDHLRHSCAHLLAAAVLDIFPDTKQAIGPPIENGFYYDFEFASPISEKEFPFIEKKMKEIVMSWNDFSRLEVTQAQAKKAFVHNSYKQALINEFSKEGQKLTIYQSGTYKDLCRGGHIDSPKEKIKHFKLLSIAGAYWRGDEKNKMLTRIYGTCFPTKKELDYYLWQVEEAKKRDHRKLGRELDLFLISDQIGSGLPLFTRKGTILRRIIEQYLIDTKEKADYQFVWTPHIAKQDIYKKSKHLGKYDAMFNPMRLDKEKYILKPMNCPHHFMFYLSQKRTYKELPLRIAENGTVYRYEKSGELNGLLRVRSATIDDTHTFVRGDSIAIADELKTIIFLIKKIIEDFGFKDYRVRISTRDKNNLEKYIGDQRIWKVAEDSLERVASEQNIDSFIGEGEAAFYGPKIDFLIRDSIGREWQCSTVQLDFQQPRNFDMKYISKNGEEKKPAIIHIAMLGSIERFIAILIEHYAGALPLWLSPVQVAILPVSDRFHEYAQKIYTQLVKNTIRTSLNTDNKTLGAKIRAETLQKTPCMLILGKKEMQSGFVSVRTREGENKEIRALYEFITTLKEQIENRL